MHEVRYSSVYPAHHFIWSGRFDLLYYARQAIPPESIIRLIDFKSGRFSPPGKDSLAYLMLRIATWLNTQTILALPEEFQRGKSIRLFPPIGTTGPNVKIKIDYISLHQFPPVITSLDQYFQDDWLDDGRFITLIGLIDKLVAMIMDQRNRLAPVLGELPDTTTGKFDRWLKSTR
jgi:hypothetical protein